MEYHSATKRKKFESFKLRWLNLEPIGQNEVSKQKQMSYIHAYIWNLEKWY